MRAIIIDPWNQKVYATDEKSWGLDEMYKHLSGPDGFRPCEDINSVRVGRDQMLWVDGEGLLIPDVPVWELRGYPRPLAGKGLILGFTEAGDNKGTYLEPGWVESMISWKSQVTTGSLAPTTEEQIDDTFVVTVGEAILKDKPE